MTNNNKLVPIDIIKLEEPWSEAHLVNGDTVLFKPVIAQVLQITTDDNKPVIDAHGMRQYAIVSSNVSSTKIKSK